MGQSSSWLENLLRSTVAEPDEKDGWMKLGRQMVSWMKPKWLQEGVRKEGKEMDKEKETEGAMEDCFSFD